MRYVVAGIVLIVTVLFGIIANFYVLNENDESTKSKLIATTLIDNLKKISIIQWIIITIVSLCVTYIAFRFGGTEMSISEQIGYLSVAIVLFSIMIIDWKTYKIPNMFVFGLFVTGLLLLISEIMMQQDMILLLVIKRFAGLVLCVVMFYVLSRLTKDGIGMGDVKIIAVMGWMLGFSLTILSVMFSLIICSIVACFLLVSKKKDKNDKIPFGPFLFLGYISLLLFII